ncbi:FmdE family protein [Desulfovibrio litoralis]|uniref:Formylmethanofuran dehydrogenase subunit E n=1 Tax=Desulfovibrio litoralis DSM 11393 TaxID=1121455 RepID=A0A1M7S1G1_9BACT|nr:FmdE family protein [Desulfovibrio litoralis]SHN52205.1 formylmethanofuran dehydrogenase subunit E [Desulfovibrio litoralis DSM 11393]
MNIDNYTFEEFKDYAAQFHGYPAPGLLIGGYMVAMAKKALPEGVLFEAVVETKKCLPDAVQLLTLCSVGNNWMKVINLGRYALSLFDKYTGEGYRVYVDVAKLAPYPEISSWFLKQKAKKDQDTEQLLKEIKTAGDTICSIAPIRIIPNLLGHSHMGTIGICPQCKEAFPQEDGVLCRGCQGEAPYTYLCNDTDRILPQTKILKAEDAIGKKALHDMTQIVPGKEKGPLFVAGQTLEAGDVCRLQQIGRFSVAVEDNNPNGFIHENDGVKAFAKRMSGNNITFELPPKEGKINFSATTRGLLCVDKKRLEAFNMLEDVMCATRQDATIVEAGSQIGGTRVIPLYIADHIFAEALQRLSTPLFSVAPFRKARVGILVTGTEVFKGLITDKFIPIISKKVEQYECTVVKTEIAPDDKNHIQQSIQAIKEAGADLLITTGGLSVDPEDLTRHALTEAGLTDALYGAPVLPGTMSLVGRILSENINTHPTQTKADVSTIRQPQNGEMQVIGVPACALYYKTTLFDILLSRLLAGRIITRHELASMGEGGFCMNCKICTWPKCFFVK